MGGVSATRRWGEWQGKPTGLGERLVRLQGVLISGFLGANGFNGMSAFKQGEHAVSQQALFFTKSKTIVH
jgi:hypothetical protein